MIRRATRFYRQQAVRPSDGDEGNWIGETHPLAVMLCAVGFFMHILLSGPVLNIIGIDYGSETASTLTKIHPGSYLIMISFLILICSRRDPFEQIIRIARQHTAYFSLVAIYCVLIIYWMLRGPKGVGLLFDVHIVMPMCAIVFCYAPRNWLRGIVYSFVTLAVANSAIGIFEAATHIRIFPFDPEWEVLKQDYFRASAFLGHPLINAAFAAMAMFVLLDLKMPLALKAVIFPIMLASLVAFGGRSALIFSIIGLIMLGMINIRHFFQGRNMTVMRMMLALLAVIMVPVVCFAILYGMLHSGMGERLLNYNSLSDDSAHVRMATWRVFDYMNTSDLLFGTDSDRIAAIGYNAGITDPSSDIESPWVLMFMFLGGVMFTLWGGGLIACVWRLLAGASLELKLAVIVYFFIATTSNSFGRKDPDFLITAGIVVCAKQLKMLERSKAWQPWRPKMNQR